MLLAAAAAHQLERAQLARDTPGPPVSVDAEANSMSTQTDFIEDVAAREEMAHWQQQLSAVSQWLKTGAALLQDAPGMGSRN